MMTILVVFLLVNFSVEGEIFTPSRDVCLPGSESRVPARPALSVEVSLSGISVDGEPVAALAATMEGDAMLIAPLKEMLASRRLGATGLPPLTIQCDRAIDFRVLKKVVYTCSQAGGSDFALLVRREEP